MKAWCLALLPLCAQAAEIAGTRFPDQWRVQDQALVLNGLGLREYGFMKIDVYAAALYLPSKQSDAQAVLDSPAAKVLTMKFFRDVSREDTLKAWDHYLAQNCVAPCVLPAAAIVGFKALVPATRKGDEQTYVFSAQGLQLLSQGLVLGEVQDAAFARLLLSTWIGAVPTTEDLKRGLLGR